MDTKRLTIELGADEHHQFKIIAAVHQKTMKNLLVEFIRELIKERDLVNIEGTDRKIAEV